MEHPPPAPGRAYSGWPSSRAPVFAPDERVRLERIESNRPPGMRGVLTPFLRRPGVVVAVGAGAKRGQLLVAFTPRERSRLPVQLWVSKNEVKHTP